MTSGAFLSALTVVLILVVVAVLTVLAAYFTERCAEGSGNGRLLFWLVVIWLVACALILALSPSALGP